MAQLATLLLLLLQQVYSQADFVQVAGTSLRARYDAAVTQGQRGSDEAFWVAYRFPVRPNVRITTWGENNMTITTTTTSDGIEWIPDKPDTQRIAIFLLTGKADGLVQKTRLIDLAQNFRVHDRKVYWLGEPNADDSMALLDKLMTDQPPKFNSSFAHYMSLHDSPRVGDHLLQLAKSSTASNEVRRAAISYLGREISRQAGDELNKLTMDPNTEIQRQAVAAISRRADDDSIPSLIRVAREHPNATVRSYAISLLGQKRDPRVLAFFEQMLKK
jgi:hypothetical protein